VLVWRHLRKAGAMLQSGLWLIPETPSTRTAIEQVAKEIHELGGKALAFHALGFSESQNEDLRASFNVLRRAEYEELRQRCMRFQGHVERLIAEKDFRFDAVEEMEEDLEKRRRSMAQLTVRDVFEVEERAQVAACIKDCEAALARFIELAYLSGQDGVAEL
jgi:hypothetical protein